MTPAAAARLRALGRDLSPEATGARDFQETADIIAGLDLVISVDTAIAHLAASLGKPTWILLAQVGTDWRYERGRDECRWYPSGRLFRQPMAGDWDSVLSAVEAALADR
jgi:ADP-heptose:LPS heptosyltransferase